MSAPNKDKPSLFSSDRIKEAFVLRETCKRIKERKYRKVAKERPMSSAEIVPDQTVEPGPPVGDKLGKSEEHPWSGRPRTARSKKMIIAVQQRVWRNLKRSARQMAKYMNVSVTSTRRIVKNNLKLLPYKIRKRQYLTYVQKQKKKT